MRTVLVVMALAGCLTSDPPPADTESPVASCDARALRGCYDAPDCTWCAPVASTCTASFTPFCAQGDGWCTDGTCRQFCGESVPRCGTGLTEHHTKDGTADVCVCAP